MIFNVYPQRILNISNIHSFQVDPAISGVDGMLDTLPMARVQRQVSAPRLCPKPYGFCVILPAFLGIQTTGSSPPKTKPIHKSCILRQSPHQIGKAATTCFLRTRLRTDQNGGLKPRIDSSSHQPQYHRKPAPSHPCQPAFHARWTVPERPFHSVLCGPLR